MGLDIVIQFQLGKSTKLCPSAEWIGFFFLWRQPSRDAVNINSTM